MIGVLSFFTNQKLNKTIDEMTDIHDEIVNKASSIELLATSLQLSLEVYIQKNVLNINQFQKIKTLSDQDIKDDLHLIKVASIDIQSLESKINKRDNGLIAQKIIRETDRISDVFSKLTSQIKLKKENEVTVRLDGHILNLLALSERIKGNAQNNAEAAHENLHILSRYFQFFEFAIIFLFLAFGTLFTTQISNSIISPLLKFKETTSEISKGDYSKRVELNQEDELGDLAKSFNLMVGSIQEAQEKI